MALSKDIKQLIALAAQGPGPVPKPRMRNQPKKKPINPQHPEAVEKAQPAAEGVFEWLAGPVGNELRAEMTEQGATLLPLHGYRVGMTTEPDVLYIQREPNPNMGKFDNAHLEVETPEELIHAVGPEIVLSLHQQILHDQLFTNMAAHLRQRVGGHHG